MALASRGIAMRRLTAAGLPLPNGVISGEDVANGTLNQESYQKAASALGTPASKCLIFEDAPAGINPNADVATISAAQPHPFEAACQIACDAPKATFKIAAKMLPHTIGRMSGSAVSCPSLSNLRIEHAAPPTKWLWRSDR